MNKNRAPTLLYNSQFAHPDPVLAAHVTLPGTASVPDSVTARLRVDGATPTVGVTEGKWTGTEWRPGQTRRIALAFDGIGYASGLHGYTIDVVNWYNGAPQPTATL